MPIFTLRGANGTIESLSETGGTIRLDAGEVVGFERGHCYRDGTTFTYMQVGDRARYDAERGGVSSPNIDRSTLK